MTADTRPESALTRILAVDDNPAALYATSRVLKAAGYEVIQANTGTAALEAAGAVDLVVLDVNLPDLDGFEVCRRLRARADTARLPILHLSATFTQAGDFSQGLAAGADSYLTRPVETPVLLATVRTLLFAHQSEERRRQVDARLTALFQLAPVPIAILDRAQRHEQVNPAYCALTGFSVTQLVGTPIGPLLDLTAPLPAAGHASLLRADGSRADVDWQLATEPDSQSHILILSDTTEARRVDAQRESLLESERSARTEAERSNRLKEEFLATLSHELRNPLNAILGWSTLLARSKDLPPQVMRAVSAIERNSRLQAQMIADLLDYASIAFGKLRLHMTTLDPYPVIQQALEVLQTAAQTAEVTLQASFGDDGALVEADPKGLQQIVWNLLSNAIKFSRKGGTVELSAERRADRFELSVRDHGAGIKPEFLPRMFERFSQEDASSTRSHGGLGLGLAIVKQLVSLQSGEITAASDGPGLGACFTVTLPLSSNQAAPALSDSQTVRDDLSGLVVLVVEDDVDARDLTKRILMDAGARVVEAPSADAALTAVRAHKPHVLVSDIGMAGTDGYQLLRTLREAGFGAEQLPAIALTAFARSQDRTDSFAAGFQDHLVKPVDAQVLIKRVSRLWRKLSRPS